MPITKNREDAKVRSSSYIMIPHVQEKRGIKHTLRFFVASRLYLTFLFIMTMPSMAYANCALSGHPARPTGAIIHNADYDVLQVCRSDGAWIALSPIGCPAGDGCASASGPTGCPNIGDTCASDGTIYAGDFSGYKLYVAADDAPSNMTLWRPTNITGMAYCDTAPYTGGSCDSGRENTQLLKDHATTFPAAEYCADLVAHGHDDWYLPSRNELALVYDNLKAGNPAGTHNFLNNYYWSSSEHWFNEAWGQYFHDGFQTEQNGKNSPGRIRCVRH